MAFTEFYCNASLAGASNLNAGSETGGAARLTYASGTWVQATGVFTVASGNPTSDGVVVGDFASVYPDATATDTVFIGRVTARSTTTITVSLTAIAGAAPANGTTNTTLKIGGTWLGPNAADKFPFDFMTGVLNDGTNLGPRVNFKNNATYNITAGLTHTKAGQIAWQGYTSSPGDLGRATIDGGTSGASYSLITLATFGSSVYDFIWQNNGATGTVAGVAIGSSNMFRCIVQHVRGSGIVMNATCMVSECEIYDWNQSNTSASAAGMAVQGNSSAANALRCYAHDASAGTNCHGFGGLGTFTNCICDSASGSGLVNTLAAGSWLLRFINCDVYNCLNGMDLSLNNQTGTVYAENCNFVKNSGWGIKANGTAITSGLIYNSGFGSGSQANTSGNSTYANSAIVESGSFSYASGATPWNAPSTGDFSIVLAAAEYAGRGNFTATLNSKTGTLGHPDVGAAAHNIAGMIRARIFTEF
jgi:hypothetical protein